MNTQQIIELYRPAIIQIATQASTGTGFYLKEFDLIVTNEHVVGKNAEVTIAGRLFEKRLARVWYTDRKHDLAFLQPPMEVQIPEVQLGSYEDTKDGDVVVAIGHPFGLNYTATQGVISKVDRVRDGVKYIQIDAAINPGNSGGPLVNKDGKKKTVQRKVYPGYVLVEMIQTDESWYVVRNTPGVTGFVGSTGSGSKPTALLPEEVEAILKHMGMEEPKPKIDFELKENVRVKVGPFANFVGSVEEIIADKGKLKVLVNMFGRETPLELDFGQVEKV